VSSRPRCFLHLRAALLGCATLALGACSAVQHSPSFPRLEPPQIYQEEHISLTVGQRSFEDDLAEPVDDQLFLALNIEVVPVNSWLALDFGLNYSVDRVTQNSGGLGVVDLEVDVWELSAGLHHEFKLGRSPIRPYIGAGASILLVDAMLTDSAGASLFEDQDTVLGTYARGGLLFEIGQGNQLGIDLRYLSGEAANIGGLMVDSDYVTVGVIFRGSY